MKRLHLLTLAATLAAASSAFANDVDFYPNGFVSSVIRDAQSDQRRTAVRPIDAADANNGGGRAYRTRAQVVAETREVARLGLLNSGEAGPIEATRSQERQIEQAGRRALAIEAAAAK